MTENTEQTFHRRPEVTIRIMAGGEVVQIIHLPEAVFPAERTEYDEIEVE